MSRIFSSAEPGPQLTWTAMTFNLIPNTRGGSVLVCWGTKTKANVSWKTRVAVDRLRDNEIALSDGYPSRAEVTIMDSNDRPLLAPIILEITKTKGELSVTAKRPQPGAPGSRPSFGRFYETAGRVKNFLTISASRCPHRWLAVSSRTSIRTLVSLKDSVPVGVRY